MAIYFKRPKIILSGHERIFKYYSKNHAVCKYKEHAKSKSLQAAKTQMI